ncbi:plastocyanin/azurin family copper-binding protein [Halobacterium hubeiense]|uniref:plastocyanin/azurin family copper-binding protein n=1 Tax=Halobacterium hubeiense TaxID=1407499 RepID=UPI003C792CDB
MDEHYSRRRFLASTGVAGVAALAGCSGGGGGDGGGDGGGGEQTTSEPTETESGDGGGGGNVVQVGPDGEFVFEPEEITVSVGDTVTWEFASPSHNVCAYPEMSDEVSIPEDASGFGTMEQGGNSMALVSQGETYEHTFETAGEYTYVCVPHVASDMIGTVVVE